MDTQNLLSSVCEAWPPSRWLPCGVLVGCSGGADSVALALAMATLRQQAVAHSGDEPRPTGSITLVHVNHGLRGEESDADERSVCELAARLEFPVHTIRLDGHASDEATLRNRRYTVFNELAHASGARYVAVGHTADDNAETILHHLFRGSGPAGLAGIAPQRFLGSDAVLIRPLLAIRRHIVRNWLTEHNVVWREDSSNHDTRYTRNWIRHELMPLVESRYRGAAGRIASAGEHQREWRKTMERLAIQWLAEHELAGDLGCLVIRQGPSAPQSVVIEAVQQCWRRLMWPRIAMTSDHWQQVAHTILSAEARRYTLPGNIQAHADSHALRLSR